MTKLKKALWDIRARRRTAPQRFSSRIAINAKLIRHGNLSLEYGPDFQFHQSADLTESAKRIQELYLQEVKRCGVDNVALLSPFRQKTETGVNALNEVLRNSVNPKALYKKEAVCGKRTLREGDKVMQIKNDYNQEWEILGRKGVVVETGKGVFNGDIGYIKSIDTYMETVTVLFEEDKVARYPIKNLSELEHAYAVTIHKSQGSEYPAVLLPLLAGPKLLFNRNLLYTAITRAKHCVTILGSRNTICNMIDNADENKRYSSLCERICEVAG